MKPTKTNPFWTSPSSRGIPSQDAPIQEVSTLKPPFRGLRLWGGLFLVASFLVLTACDSLSEFDEGGATPSVSATAVSNSYATLGTETRITENLRGQYFPATHGDLIVWEDTRNGRPDIYAYDLSTGTETQITDDPDAQYYPAVSGNLIVWHDSRHGNSDIYMTELSTTPGNSPRPLPDPPNRPTRPEPPNRPISTGPPTSPGPPSSPGQP